MTRKQMKIISSKLRELVNQTNNAPLLNLDGALLDKYEELENEDAQVTGEGLYSVIANSHIIDYQAHQVEDAKAYWVQVATDCLA